MLHVEEHDVEGVVDKPPQICVEFSPYLLLGRNTLGTRTVRLVDSLHVALI
jgi:hypothetical protein